MTIFGEKNYLCEGLRQVIRRMQGAPHLQVGLQGSELARAGASATCACRSTCILSTSRSCPLASGTGARSPRTGVFKRVTKGGRTFSTKSFRPISCSNDGLFSAGSLFRPSHHDVMMACQLFWSDLCRLCRSLLPNSNQSSFICTYVYM